MKTRDQLCLYYSWCACFAAKDTLDIYHYKSWNKQREQVETFKGLIRQYILAQVKLMHFNKIRFLSCQNKVASMSINHLRQPNKSVTCKMFVSGCVP